ncbi:hypothetical protein RZS08_28915, partial [Arthrospira platensis SPKY1]|nr:hypothetical protein [Arthrospira platensis SPKY1]
PGVGAPQAAGGGIHHPRPLFRRQVPVPGAGSVGPGKGDPPVAPAPVRDAAGQRPGDASRIVAQDHVLSRDPCRGRHRQRLLQGRGRLHPNEVEIDPLKVVGHPAESPGPAQVVLVHHRAPTGLPNGDPLLAAPLDPDNLLDLNEGKAANGRLVAVR